MSYIFEHTTLGFCLWDLVALAVLAGVIIWFAVKRHKMVKTEKELEDQLLEEMKDLEEATTE